MPNQEAVWHVKTVAGKNARDPWAQPSALARHEACGCKVAPCGFVIAKPRCPHHGNNAGVKKAQAHFDFECPGAPKVVVKPDLQGRLF